MMKKMALLAFLWLCMSVPALAAGTGGLEELYVYPSIQYFTWKEFHGGSRLLRETGPLYGAGAAATLENPVLDENNYLTLNARVELFGNVVDYDGQTQAPNPLPVKTEVTYFGTKGEIGVGWRHAFGPFYLEPFGGTGIRWWHRDIHGTMTADANGNAVSVQGYVEEWLSGYARAGLRSGYIVSKNFRVFAEAGAKYPFYTENRADYPDAGSVTVKPRGELSAFAELGALYKWFRPCIFYEGFRYSKSPIVNGLFQPDSEGDIIGVQLGVSFR
jgi:hypothetical protein